MDETTVPEAGTADGVRAKRPRLEESGAQKVPTVLRKDLFDPEQARALRESVSGTMCGFFIASAVSSCWNSYPCQCVIHPNSQQAQPEVMQA